MRLILMRHGESQNNAMKAISKELWDKHRLCDPELSAQGMEDCKKLGLRMKETRIKVDHMYTSCVKRAILSLKYVREAIDGADLPCHVMTQIHEEGGPYLGDTVQSGLKRSEVEEIIPDI